MDNNEYFISIIVKNNAETNCASVFDLFLVCSGENDNFHR